MKKLTLIFLCVFALFATRGAEAAIAQDAQVPRSAGGAGAANQTVRVSNSREFLEALGSDRVIEMSAGVYNLSEWDPYLSDKGALKLAEGVSWKDQYGEGELHLEGIKNLTIRGLGAKGSDTEIAVAPLSSHVLVFENCGDIAIEWLHAKHSDGAYSGRVFHFENSSRITIAGAGMYGGKDGLFLSNVSDIKVTDSVIYECTETAVFAAASRNVAFENCVFRDNGVGGRHLEIVTFHRKGSGNISFSNCTFTGNQGKMFDVSDTTIEVWNSVFSGNVTELPVYGSVNVAFYGGENVEFYSCVFDAAGVGGYSCEYDGQTNDFIWLLNGVPLPQADIIHGVSEANLNFRWISVSPKTVSRMEGSQSGVIFLEMKNGNYYFLPFENAHHIQKIIFTDKDKHIDVILTDEGGKYDEKGFSFPELKEQDDKVPLLEGGGA